MAEDVLSIPEQDLCEYLLLEHRRYSLESLTMAAADLSASHQPVFCSAHIKTQHGCRIPPTSTVSYAYKNKLSWTSVDTWHKFGRSWTLINISIPFHGMKHIHGCVSGQDISEDKCQVPTPSRPRPNPIEVRPDTFKFNMAKAFHPRVLLKGDNSS